MADPCDKEYIGHTDVWAERHDVPALILEKWQELRDVAFAYPESDHLLRGTWWLERHKGRRLTGWQPWQLEGLLS